MSRADEQRWGQILFVSLPKRRPLGHEQGGMRPCILISDPSAVHQLRYPMLVIAPLTTRTFPNFPLYPCLETGIGGLPEVSTVLLDQLTAIDTNRVQGYIGTLTEQEFAPIQKGLSLMFNSWI